MTKPQLINALELILEALEHSLPKAAHYREPKDRHAQAKRLASQLLEEAKA